MNKILVIDPGSKELGFWTNFAGFGEIKSEKADFKEMVKSIKPLIDLADVSVCENNTGNHISWSVIKFIGVLDYLYPSIVWIHPQTWKSALKKKFPEKTLKSKKDFWNLAIELNYPETKGDKGHCADAFLINFYFNLREKKN